MFKRWLLWLFSHFRPQGRIAPHPDMSGDGGERRNLERYIESNTRHVGSPPPRA